MKEIKRVHILRFTETILTDGRITEKERERAGEALANAIKAMTDFMTNIVPSFNGFDEVTHIQTLDYIRDNGGE